MLFSCVKAFILCSNEFMLIITIALFLSTLATVKLFFVEFFLLD